MLEECAEALNYALAYDEESPIAHCLMGRLQMEYFKDYETALYHFEQALYYNVAYVETYYHYLVASLSWKNWSRRNALSHSRKISAVVRLICCRDRKRSYPKRNMLAKKLKL